MGCDLLNSHTVVKKHGLQEKPSGIEEDLLFEYTGVVFPVCSYSLQRIQPFASQENQHGIHHTFCDALKMHYGKNEKQIKAHKTKQK